MKYILLGICVISLIGCNKTSESVNIEIEPVKVMTYNIRFDNPGDSLNSWPYRKKMVADLISFYQPDIFGLQEALIHQIQFLDSIFIKYSWYGVGRDDGKNKGEFSPVFFNKEKFELIKDSTIWLSETPEKVSKGWDAALPRIATILFLRDVSAKEEFIIINTHFDHIGVNARVQSAGLLVNLVNKLVKRQPVVLMGDFNVNPESEAYTIFTSEGGLNDAFTITRKPHHGALRTFSGFMVNEGLLGDRIDFIFVSDNIEVLRHAILTGHKNGRYPSDHLPVFAEIEL